MISTIALRWFFLHQDLYEHQLREHNASFPEDVELPTSAYALECLLCQRRFVCQPRQAILRHLKMEHTKAEIGTSFEGVIGDYMLLKSAKFSCRVCRFSAKSHGEWLAHFKEGPFNDPICPVGVMPQRSVQQKVMSF